jgi:methanogenic corrinoid protein MtbC1
MAVGQAISEVRQAWLSACLAFDEQKAERVLAQAFALYSPETVYFELIMPALVEIGAGWYEGEITVHQEHFASALATRRLETLLVATPNPTKTGRIIAGCPSGEDHIFAPLLLTLILRRLGRQVVYLGANVPSVRLESTIAGTNSALVILVAQQLPSAVAMQEMGLVLQKLGVPMAYGGQVFNLMPALRARITGHFLGERLDMAPEMVEQLLVSAPPIPTAEKISESYQQALTAYRRNQARIEAEIWQTIDETNVLYQLLNLNLANRNLAQNITAALTFGDMTFMGNDWLWIKGLLNHQRIPNELLLFYLQAYHQAVNLHLGSVGQPIRLWFDELISKAPVA